VDYVDVDFEMGEILTQQSEKTQIQTKVTLQNFNTFLIFFVPQEWLPLPARRLKFKEPEDEASVSSNTAMAHRYATYHAPAAAPGADVAQDMTNVPNLLQPSALTADVPICPACGVGASPAKDCMALYPLQCSQCRLVWHLHCARLSRPPRFAFSWVCKACLMAVD
jgi:hypothetical protein